MQAFVKANRCQRCRLLLEKCICSKLSPIDSKFKINLLLHAKEMGRVSNTGLIARRVIPSINEVHYGTPDYRFKPEDVFKEGKKNLILYPDATATLGHYKDQGFKPEDINLIVPDGNWPQANSMTKKLLTSGLFNTVRLASPVGGRYWLRLDHNHEHGVSTLEAIATSMEVMSLDKESKVLRHALEDFVYQSLIIRGKVKMAQKYLETSKVLK